MNLLKSKRFWTAVASLIVVVLAEFGFDIPLEQLLPPILVVVGWLIGDSIRGIPK